jgi:membrane-bound serine protease (ClpP class)
MTGFRLVIAAAVLGSALLAPRAEAACVVAVRVDGVVHPVTVEMLGRAIQQAEQQGCALVLMELNTPGGFLEATREATEKMLASGVPVAAYVTPSGGRAASAGFFLLEAADVAAMAPGTHTGAAHPVLLAGTPDETMKRKIENDAAASLRTLVDRRGRNSALAEKAVLESKSFTDQEAMKDHLVDLVAADERDLLAQLSRREIKRFDGRTVSLNLEGATILRYEPTVRLRIQAALADPNIALALTLLGALGIYVEFTSPGVILPGVAGAIALVLGLSALSVLPLNWTGVTLLLLAMALFVLELKFASHGILGTGATVSLILGALLLIDSPIPEMRIQIATALAIALPFAAIVMFLVTIVVKARVRKPDTGKESIIGAEAVALTALSPDGQVLYHGEIWQARASQPVVAGGHVRITEIKGLELFVEPSPSGE